MYSIQKLRSDTAIACVVPRYIVFFHMKYLNNKGKVQIFHGDTIFNCVFWHLQIKNTTVISGDPKNKREKIEERQIMGLKDVTLVFASDMFYSLCGD